MIWLTSLLAVAVPIALGGEARAVRADLEIAVRPAAPSVDGTLPSYLAHALAAHPTLTAAFARWEAAVHRIARARALPEPTLSLGLYLQAVETRVGPQQARVGLRQAFPWPSRLTAGADAAAEAARAAQHRFDAEALAVAERVAHAYWSLWEVRQTRVLHADHAEVLDGLAASIRGRLETGGASLADVQQVDLSRARLADRLAAMDAAELAATARLRAVVGADADVWDTATAPPPPAVPVESGDALVDAALRHPALAAAAAGVRSADAAARAAGARRLPGFALGADWIPTGPAADPSMPDSGKDAVVASIGLQLPLWQGAYARDVAAAQAEADARNAEHDALSLARTAELTATRVAVEDTGRRVDLVRDTLLPQAESAHRSVLGAVTSGRGSVAQALLSQQDLLELRVELARARAEHARAWATLRRVVGRDVLPAPEEAP